MIEGSQECPPTVTIGGDLTVGAIGYGAMQLTGPKVWGEYPDHDRAIALLREELRGDDVVLVKASKAAALWRVADALLEAGTK